MNSKAIDLSKKSGSDNVQNNPSKPNGIGTSLQEQKTRVTSLTGLNKLEKSCD